MILPEGKASSSKLSLSSLATELTTDSEFEEDVEDLQKSPWPPPPQYLGKRPGTQVTYTFTPQMNPANSMIMAPPNYLDDYPSYYISVDMNCFTPFSYITTIRRAGWAGKVIADFEMGLPGVRKTNTLCIHGYECPIDEVLESNPKTLNNVHSRIHGKVKGTLDRARWISTGRNPQPPILQPYWQCFLGKEKMITNALAKFMPSAMLRRPGRTPDATRLDVAPQGHDYLDEIVLSLLIIERMRSFPSTIKDLPVSVFKELF